MIAAPSVRPTRSPAAPLVWSQFLADQPEALNPIYLRVFVGAHLVAPVKGQSSVCLVRAVRSILTS